MKFNKILTICLTAGTLLSCGRTLKDGNYTLQVLSTNDVHGTWFDSTYTDGNVKKSLLAMNYYIDSVRTADGAGNVLWKPQDALQMLFLWGSYHQHRS